MKKFINSFINCEIVKFREDLIAIQINVGRDVFAAKFQYDDDASIQATFSRYPNGDVFASDVEKPMCKGCAEAFDELKTFIRKYFPKAKLQRKETKIPKAENEQQQKSQSLQHISTLMMELNKRLSRLEQAYYNYALPESR